MPIQEQVYGPENRIVSAKLGSPELKNVIFNVDSSGAQPDLSLVNFVGKNEEVEDWRKNVKRVRSADATPLSVSYATPFTGSSNDTATYNRYLASLQKGATKTLRQWTTGGVTGTLPEYAYWRICLFFFPVYSYSGYMVRREFSGLMQYSDAMTPPPPTVASTYGYAPAPKYGEFTWIYSEDHNGPGYLIGFPDYVTHTLPVEYIDRPKTTALFYDPVAKAFVHEATVVSAVSSMQRGSLTVTYHPHAIHKPLNAEAGWSQTSSYIQLHTYRKTLQEDAVGVAVPAVVELTMDAEYYDALVAGSCSIPGTCSFTFLGKTHALPVKYHYRNSGAASASELEILRYTAPASEEDGYNSYDTPFGLVSLECSIKIDRLFAYRYRELVVDTIPFTINRDEVHQIRLVRSFSFDLYEALLSAQIGVFRAEPSLMLSLYQSEFAGLAQSDRQFAFYNHLHNLRTMEYSWATPTSNYIRGTCSTVLPGPYSCDGYILSDTASVGCGVSSVGDFLGPSPSLAYGPGPLSLAMLPSYAVNAYGVSSDGDSTYEKWYTDTNSVHRYRIATQTDKSRAYSLYSSIAEYDSASGASGSVTYAGGSLFSSYVGMGFRAGMPIITTSDRRTVTTQLGDTGDVWAGNCVSFSETVASASHLVHRFSKGVQVVPAEARAVAFRSGDIPQKTEGHSYLIGRSLELDYSVLATGGKVSLGTASSTEGCIQATPIYNEYRGLYTRPKAVVAGLQNSVPPELGNAPSYATGSVRSLPSGRAVFCAQGGIYVGGSWLFHPADIGKPPVWITPNGVPTVSALSIASVILCGVEASSLTLFITFADKTAALPWGTYTATPTGKVIEAEVRMTDPYAAITGSATVNDISSIGGFVVEVKNNTNLARYSAGRTLSVHVRLRSKDVQTSVTYAVGLPASVEVRMPLCDYGASLHSVEEWNELNDGTAALRHDATTSHPADVLILPELSGTMYGRFTEVSGGRETCKVLMAYSAVPSMSGEFCAVVPGGLSEVVNTVNMEMQETFTYNDLLAVLEMVGENIAYAQEIFDSPSSLPAQGTLESGTQHLSALRSAVSAKASALEGYNAATTNIRSILVEELTRLLHDNASILVNDFVTPDLLYHWVTSEVSGGIYLLPVAAPAVAELSPPITLSS